MHSRSSPNQHRVLERHRAAALRIHGRCPSCDTDRVLPSLTGDGTPICTACAGFTCSYACSRCGTEGKLHGQRLCTLNDRLTELLDDGTGRIRPEPAPLHRALTAMTTRSAA